MLSQKTLEVIILLQGNWQAKSRTHISLINMITWPTGKRIMKQRGQKYGVKQKVKSRILFVLQEQVAPSLEQLNILKNKIQIFKFGQLIQ